MSTHLFNELLHDYDHEGWNEFDLPKLTLDQIRFLCRALGAPKSGKKEDVVTRLLAVRQVRKKAAKFSGENAIEEMVAEFSKEALKWMAKEAGQWRSGNKRQLAMVILNWRDRARIEGERFVQNAYAQVRTMPRQLGLAI